MDLFRRPAADLGAAVQEDLHEPDNAGLVDLDAGITDRALGDRQSNALQQRKVDVHVAPLGLIRGKATGDGLELLTDRFVAAEPEPPLASKVNHQAVRILMMYPCSRGGLPARGICRTLDKCAYLEFYLFFLLVLWDASASPLSNSAGSSGL